LTQDVFTRIAETKTRTTGRFDPARPFPPWIYRIAGNILTDHRRRAGPEPLPLVTDLPGGPPAPSAADAQLEHDLDDCLGELTEREREFLLLWQGSYGHLSQTEIAELWRVSDAQVSRIKQEALTKLRDCMEQKGYA
jgi:RNA polymerase sigma factor (sigma-70 family)